MENTPENNKDGEDLKKRGASRKYRGIKLPSDHPIYSQGWTVGAAPILRSAPPRDSGESDKKSRGK